MKRLEQHVFVPLHARQQLLSFQRLMVIQAEIKERVHVLPFFEASRDLCLLFSHYTPAFRNPDRIAHEFVISGDFIADLIVGDWRSGRYLLVEFEDGTPYSVFSRRKKASPPWATRYEGAFSQIVDWLWKLEDMRSTANFTYIFGNRDVVFDGLIVTGKGLNLAPQEAARLKWRVEKVRVDSKAIAFVSYDDFCSDAGDWLGKF